MEMDLDIAAEQHATLALLRTENTALREQLADLQAKQPVVVGYIDASEAKLLQERNYTWESVDISFEPEVLTDEPIYIDPQQEVKG
jgi:hypothetical protein